MAKYRVKRYNNGAFSASGARGYYSGLYTAKIDGRGRLLWLKMALITAVISLNGYGLYFLHRIFKRKLII